MAYGTGFGAVQEVMDRARSSQSVAKVAHPADPRVLWNLGWKNGETKLVRFLSDAVLAIPMHAYTPTKDGGHKDFACTLELQGDLQRPCWICENMTKKVKTRNGDLIEVPLKPTPKVLGVVVVREEDEKGNVVDVTRELDILVDPNEPEGATETSDVPLIALVNQGQNFWRQVNGYYSSFRTTLDRDYSISRKGDRLDTEYTVIPQDVDDDYISFRKAERDQVAPIAGPALWDQYGIVRHGDEDPILEIVIKWIEAKGTTEWFERWLPITSGGVTAVADEAPARAGTSKFSGLKDRIARDYPKE